MFMSTQTRPLALAPAMLVSGGGAPGIFGPAAPAAEELPPVALTAEFVAGFERTPGEDGLAGTPRVAAVFPRAPGVAAGLARRPGFVPELAGGIADAFAAGLTRVPRAGFVAVLERAPDVRF